MNKDFGVGTIIEHDNKFLIVKEKISRPEIGKVIDMYSFPLGHPEDETLEQAAIREVLEETGYQIKIDRIVGFYDLGKAFGIAYTGSLISETQGAYNNQEIKEVLWMTAEDILTKDLRPAVKEILQDYLGKKNYPLTTITTVKL